MIVLTVDVVDRQTDQRFEKTFDRFPVRIGRNPLNDLQIDRPYISQFHAAVEIRGKTIAVRDLGSANGTLHDRRRIERDDPVDVTTKPEVTIGPMLVHMSLADAPVEEPITLRGGWDVLDATEMSTRPEDPLIREVVPYIDVHRAAWRTVYRMVYDHLVRLPSERRTSYIERLAAAHPLLALEPDFAKIARFYGVDLGALADASPAVAALSALSDISRALVPRADPPREAVEIVAFARRMREAFEVFLKCFSAFRDSFDAGGLDRDMLGEPCVLNALDERELATLLVGPSATSDATREVLEVFAAVIRRYGLSSSEE